MSTYDPDAVRRYFDELGDGEWARFEQSPVEEVKLAVHVHHLEKHVRPGSRVLEVGAGPGRFTCELLRLGCTVVVTDISEVQLDLNRKRVQGWSRAGRVEGWHNLDVSERSPFPDRSFDVVLCYGGPLSYTLDRRHMAAVECARVLRKGGTALFSVMSLWGTAHHALPFVLSVPPDANAGIIRTGDLTEETLPYHDHPCHLFRADELRDLLQAAGLEVSEVAASNCVSTGWEEVLQEGRSDPNQWSQLLRLEIEAVAQPGCVDMGTHIIAVTRKAE